jgi:hypothetical protein
LPRLRRVHLHTVGHVLTELGRQYRRADDGDLGWQDARAAAAILKEIRALIEGDALEQRIAAIERALADAGAIARGKPNGHDSRGRPVGPRP